MAFSQGLVSGTDIPIEHLDYDYIGKCTKSSEVEKLLKILRSNKEGHYPDLIRFTENKLEELDPSSKLLIRVEKARNLKDLPSTDSSGITDDLEKWEQQMNAEDAGLQATPPDSALLNGKASDGSGFPPIRKTGNVAKETQPPEASSAKTCLPRDHQTWDKFDVEGECAKVEEGEGPVVEGEGSCRAMDGKLSQRELNMSAVEKTKMAAREKEKGNEAFRAGDYDEALAYYSRSLLFEPSSIPAHNNRAITLIKLQRHQLALQDCGKVLQLEPSNIKALLRRGMAGVCLKQWEKVERDMEQLLKAEPKNKKGQEMLKQAREELAKSAVKGAKKKGRKVQIEEVEEEEETSVAPPTGDVIKTLPMPEDVVKLKEKGNDMFRRGQYDMALGHYTTAIRKLEKAGSGHEDSLSTVYNNRAACHLKNGNSNACVNDCTKSLHLVPINIKALVRRAQAYEFMEKYRLAYIDNQLALSLDRSMQTVYAANTRIITLLKEQDGNSWRDKLPHHPDQQRITTALASASNQMVNGNTTPPTTSVTPTSTAATPTTPFSTAATPTTPFSTAATPLTPLSTAATPLTPPSTAATPPTQSITTATPASADTKVTQTATPIPTTSQDVAPPLHPEPTSIAQFNKAKAEGNTHVRNGRYLEALNCYSLCVLACPDKVVGYTNRALCHLKLDSAALAEGDCNKALELEPHNIKALYRRALARKALERFSDSMKDLKHLLEQDNENSAAKTEYAEVKQLWEKQLRHLQATNQQQGKKPSKKKTKQHKNKESAKERNQTTQQSQLEQLLAETKAKKDRLKKESIELSSKENPSEYLSAGKTTYYKPPETTAKRRRKVVVEEEEEAKGGGQEGGAGPKEGRNEEAGPKEGGNEETGPREGGNEEGDHHTITGDTKNARKVGDGKLTPFEFVQQWNSISRGVGCSQDHATLLTSIPPHTLPELINIQLEGDMLSDIIRAISKEFLPHKRYQQSADLLLNLSKVPRFQIVSKFLDKQDRTELLGVLNAIEKCGSISKTTVTELRKDYGLSRST